MNKKNIVFVGGYWAPNIGNAFFNLGADYVLKQAFPDANVTMIYDQPGYVTFWDRTKGNPKNALEFIKNVKADYLVILGPCITKSFIALWGDTIKHLTKKGTKYMILSAGMMHHNDEVIEDVKKFLKEYEPHMFVTRDVPTYETFKDTIKNSYCGVDLAYFLPDAYKPVETDLGPFMALNFDKIPEPNFIETLDKNRSVFSLGDKNYELKLSNIETKLGAKTDRFTDMYIYFKSLFPARKRSSKLGNYNIIRTDHRYAPMMLRKVYRYPNSFCSDIPHTYLNIYAESSLTLSDRVHACAVTLAYGNEAMFFAKTGRSALLDRVGAKDINKRPIKIDMNYLESEKKKVIEFMKNIGI